MPLPHPARFSVSALALLALLSFGEGACKKKDPAACSNAENVVRQALGNEDFAAARQWREYAYKHCDDHAKLDALDKEIVAKQAAVEQRKTEDDAKKRRTDELVKLFVDWVGQHKADPASAAVNVTCTEPADPKDPKKQKQHWCTRERPAGEFKLSVTYWEAEPDAYEFSTTAPGEVSCDALGANSVLKNGHQGALVHCSLTGGALAGSQALILRTAQGSALSVVTQKYVDKSDAFRRKLAI